MSPISSDSRAEWSRRLARALVAGGYKFLCGPFGAAVGYVSPTLLEDLVPAFAGWRTADDAYSFDATALRIAPTARRLEFSTMNYTAALSLGAAIKYIDTIGVRRIRQHNGELGQELLDGLVRLGAEVISPPGPAAPNCSMCARSSLVSSGWAGTLRSSPAALCLSWRTSRSLPSSGAPTVATTCLAGRPPRRLSPSALPRRKRT